MSSELPQWVEDLIADLRESRPQIRRHAVTSLAKAGSKHPRVANALRGLRQGDPDQTVRDASTAALQHLNLSLEQEQPPYPAGPVESHHAPESALGTSQSTLPPHLPMPATAPNAPEYVFALEKRVMVLEIELNNLRQAYSGTVGRTERAIARLPNSGLLSPSYLTRAFAVWGHYLVAQLLLAIPIYLLIALLVGASLFSGR